MCVSEYVSPTCKLLMFKWRLLSTFFMPWQLIHRNIGEELKSEQFYWYSNKKKSIWINHTVGRRDNRVCFVYEWILDVILKLLHILFIYSIFIVGKKDMKKRVIINKCLHYDNNKNVNVLCHFSAPYVLIRKNYVLIIELEGKSMKYGNGKLSHLRWLR